MNLDQLTPAQLRRVDALIEEKLYQRRVSYDTEDGEPYYRSADGGHCWDIPHYTTDPAAALSLLDKWGQWTIDFDDLDGPNVPAYVVTLAMSQQGRASTLPLAICQAVAEAEGLELGEVVG